LVTSKLITKCPILPVGHLVINVGATKPPAHPEDGDEVKARNVRKPSYPDAAVCLRKFH